MKKNTFLYVLRLALTLLAITALMAAALAVVNQLTAGRIAAIQQEKKAEAIQKAMRTPMEVEQIDFADDTGLVKKVCRSKGELYDKDYVAEVEIMGFNGPITMMVGIDSKGEVMGLSVVSHTETAGLGAVAAADSEAGKLFRSQFAYRYDAVAVTKDGGDIDAITGATITSRAVCSGINAALSCVHQIQQEVQS